ncbi:MAG: DNA polymerase III subunit alpha, partial [Anaerolineae bacterium]|nr:DNA polymerase III subunit alpha [Anaerolineae bacterium]
RAAREAGVKPVFGAEVTVEGILPRSGVTLTRESHPHPNPLPKGEGVRSPIPLSPGGRGARGEGQIHFHATLLAENDAGYANLSQLITAARMRCQKGEALATWDDLMQHSAGLIALSGCRQGIVAQHLLAGDKDGALRVAQDLQSCFGKDRFFVELQRQLHPGDERLVQGLLWVAERMDAPVVATNNVHYAERAGHRLHDVLTAIRSHATLDASMMQRRGNSEAYLKSAAQMARLFADRPDALRRTVEIAKRCNVTMRRGVQDLPQFQTGAVSQAEFLHALCKPALTERYGSDPGERVQRMLQHEMAIIGQLSLTNYFLIVWDIMRFARDQGIRCQGRGSAANSLVAYLLGITPIDPLAHDLVFERFLSSERPTTPDIDIDFQADRREEVIQYIYARYGREHAAMACTFVTYRQRSAVRDVAKTLDFPPDLIDALANAADRRGLAEAWGELWGGAEEGKKGKRGKEGRGNDDRAASWSITSNSPSTNHHSPISLPSPQSPASSPHTLPPTPHPPLDRRTWQLLLHLCQEIMGLPRHLGIHNGGFVISRRPLAEIV